MQINVFTDGGSRGNPGHSGYGLVIYDDDKKILFKESKYIGIKTNNEAEYAGLIGALNWIKDNKDSHKISQINFFADSQLLVRQVQGLYKVKAVHLKPLFTTVKNLLDQINTTYSFKDIRRESNELADELANCAMDRKC
ncbi:MAG: ribonuclease HI family protein [Candidatus Shapirobacteria bacterium]|jgi:ribonuclease HI|nr:ribonuclease HI family protein [Candidatus Shapirobacteria bacterium]